MTQKAPRNRDSGLGRNLLVSLGLHLAVVVFFTGVLLPGMEKERRPVYYVDLVNLPVADPQAGRPDAAVEKPEEKKPEPPRPAAEKIPPRQPPAPAAPKPEPKSEPEPEPKSQPQPQPKPEPRPEAKPVEPQRSYKETLSAIEELKRKKEIAALKERLAALAERDPRKVEDAPVGMPEGKGTEEGVSYDAWLHEFLKQAWTLSSYQVTRRNLEATVELVFAADGRLLDYRFIEESGEERFDDSVKRAVLRLEKLPNPPGRRMEKEVVFNLKDLLE